MPTGVEEIAAAAGIIKLGYDYFSGAGRDKAAVKTIGKQKDFLKGQIPSVQAFYEDLRGLTTEGFDLNKKSLTEDFINQSTDIRQESDVLAGKTGFASSGTVESKRESALDRNRGGFESSLDKLQFGLKSSLVDIEQSEVERLNQIENQLYTLDTAKAQVDRDPGRAKNLLNPFKWRL
jgi:hypothetical protein